MTIAKDDGKSAMATKLMAVMSLGIKSGDEEANTAAMAQFFKENL